MDLISRKAAIEAFGERPENWTDTPSEIEAVRSYDNAIDDLKSVPSVPAVPLDRLCEWLADQIHASVDCGIDHCDNCDAYDGTLSVKGCWMKLIKEQVMEEHNGTDNP